MLILTPGVPICQVYGGALDEIFKLDSAFYTAVAGFLSATIAITIPVSLTVLSQTSERYRSDSISRRFTNGRTSSLLLPFLLLNCFLVVLFLLVSGAEESTLKILYWIAFVGFSATLIWIYFYFEALKELFNSEILLESLFNEVEDIV